MPKTMITCSVTGNQTRQEQTPYLPITPRQIADASLEAAEAGAAMVHIHVRYPDGRQSTEIEHYREVMELIRAKNTALIINLTTGPGGRFQPGDDDPKIAGPRTFFLRPETRVEHVAALKPDVCSLDLNTMTFGSEVVINTPPNVRKMASIISDSGVLPEIELFNSSDINLLHDLLADGTIRRPLLANVVLGVKYGFIANSRTLAYAADSLPGGATWAGFGVGRFAFPMIAQSFLLGGHARIGMEDTVHIAKGELAKSNAELVSKARWIIESLGGEIASADEARQMIGLAGVGTSRGSMR